MEKHWASVLVILVILVAVANSNIFRERLQGGPDGMCITSTEPSPHGTSWNWQKWSRWTGRNALCWNSLARILWSNIPANKVKQCQTYQCSANLISANQHGDSTWQHWKNKTPLWGFVVHIFLCSSWRHKHMMGHRIQSTQFRKSRCWFTKGRLKHTERWSQGHIMGAACYEAMRTCQWYNRRVGDQQHMFEGKEVIHSESNQLSARFLVHCRLFISSSKNIKNNLDWRAENIRNLMT